MAEVAHPATPLSPSHAGEPPTYLRRNRKNRPLPRTGLTAATLVIGLIAWEALTRAGWINSLLVGSPVEVLDAARYQLTSPPFWRHLWVSTSELVVGFGSAVVVGTALGLVAGYYRRVGYMVTPWLDAFNAVPRIAFLPLLVLWFGIGFSSKAILVFACGVGLVALNVFSGVKSVNQDLLNVAKSFNASQYRIFRDVIGPSSVPFIIAGARLALGASVIGVLFAEAAGATAGLGYIMTTAAQRLDLGTYFFVVGVFTAIGGVSFYLLGILERRVRRHTESGESR